MLTPVLRLREPQDKALIEREPFAGRAPFATVHELLASLAATQPGRTALTFLPHADPEVVPMAFSARAVFEAVTRAANLFVRLGAGRSSAVGLLLPILPETHFALWGAEAAAVALPMNILLSVDHICDLLRAARARVLVALGPHSEIDLWSKALAVRERMPQLELLCIGGDRPIPSDAADFQALAADELPLPRFERATADAIAAYFHTGGTTGAPKLARHTHANQIFSAWACTQMFHYAPGVRVLNGFPMFHVAGAIIFGLAALAAGAEVILPTPGGLRNKQFVRNHWKLVERFRPTLVCGPPTSLAAMLDVPLAGADVSSVEAWITGGALLPPELAEAFQAHTGIGIREIFGMTETAGVIAITPRHGGRRKGWIGFALPYCEMRVARLEPDGVAGAPLPVGETGLVQFRGPNVFAGYVDSAKNTRILEEGGWLTTGDLGRLDEQGYVRLTGRAKDVIIRGGHNIDPLMIEEAASQHPAVAMCAAVGQPDAYAGEVPVLYVAQKPGAELDRAELAAFVERRVAERPARPRSIFVLPELPTTEVGKIFKPALRLDAAKRAVAELAGGQAGLGVRFAVVTRHDDARGCVATVTVDAPDEAGFQAFGAALGAAARGLPVVLELERKRT